MSSFNKNVLSRAFLCMLLSFFIVHDSIAQKFLVMYKSGYTSRLRFYLDDEISVRLNKENFYRTGNIVAFTDSSFLLNGNYILLSDVDAILIKKNTGGRSLLRSLTYMLPIGAVFITGVTAANSLLNDHEPLVPDNIYYLAGGMVIAGLIIYPFTYRLYHMKHHPLSIIDISFSSN
jgi:hypothetical protein